MRLIDEVYRFICKTFPLNIRPGVDFMCAPMPNFRALRPTFEKLFTGAKVQRKAQKMGAGRETFYEINPWM